MGNAPDNKRRFEEERLETNISRMRYFALYIVILQIVLQLINAFAQQLPGEGIVIPITNYVIVSLASLIVGIIYFILLTLARKKGKFKSLRSRQILVQSLLYIYVVIQLFFSTFNILSIQGVGSLIITVLMVGLIPIIPPTQSIITIAAAFVYSIALMLFTQGITDSEGLSSWKHFAFSDMRANLVIIIGVTIFISVYIYRLYLKNFLSRVALEDINNELEDLVDERTKELKAQTARAEEASMAKSRFLANMGHEIRTPLNAIAGLSQMVRNSLDKDKVAESADGIEASASRMLSMLNDVLDMSSIDIGTLELIDDDFSLPKVIRDSAVTPAASAAEKGVSFTVNAADLPNLILRGDKMRVRQAIISILDNAVQFTPKGGEVNFDVEVEVKDENGNGNSTESGSTEGVSDKYAIINIKISDTGEGIAPDFLDKLFQPFEKHDINRDGGGGAGLGLAISHKLVSMMGGEIKADSKIGEGSTFTFSLKLPVTGEVNLGAEAVADEEAPDLTGKHILIVDDIEINRQVLRGILEDTHAEVHEASDGLGAVSMFSDSPADYYDFVFMDIMMPNMDGNEATRAIRLVERPDAKTLPIVALTAKTAAEAVEEAIGAGMNVHMSKPIQYDAIMKVLRQTLL
jgi:signal transduction histidine kinase/CheY-like chemotaxis protein